MLLGCIADDFTGATDLANSLTREGMACVQYNGNPQVGPAAAAEAAVIALKTRSIAAPEAVAQSLTALHWLVQAGCRRFFFKYCSTFDSTDEGNIGPVAEALMAALDTDFTVFCPAVPENGRSVYQGHLFIGRSPLAESGMRDHPLNPMTDSNLVRVLQRQTRGKVGLVPYDVVDQGAAAIRRRIAALRQQGCRHAIVDALSANHLRDIAAASDDLPLVTGGSGLALGLPALFQRDGASARTASLPATDRLAAVLAGSCSQATNLQVARMRATHPSFQLDPGALARGDEMIEEVLMWAGSQLASGPILIYSTAPPDELASVKAALGQARASELIETAMGRIARGLVDLGVRRLVVAGGETSGAVVAALEIGSLVIGPEIDPGVPWTVSGGEPRIALALKSGNFGGPDFLTRAFEVLP